MASEQQDPVHTKNHECGKRARNTIIEDFGGILKQNVCKDALQAKNLNEPKNIYMCTQNIDVKVAQSMLKN